MVALIPGNRLFRPELLCKIREEGMSSPFDGLDLHEKRRTGGGESFDQRRADLPHHRRFPEKAVSPDVASRGGEIHESTK
jgi:hypothetical protein